MDENAKFQIYLWPDVKSEMMPFDNAPDFRQFPGGRYEAEVPKAGAYRLLAVEFGGGPGRKWAMRDVVVGSAPLEGIDLAIHSGLQLQGSLEVDGDGADPRQSGQLQIQLEGDGGVSSVLGPAPLGPVKGDGSFTLEGVSPGRWRVRIWGAPDYVKSLRLGNRTIEGDRLDISAASTGPLQIEWGTAMGKIEGTVQDRDGDPSDAHVAIFQKESGAQAGQATVDSQGHFSLPSIAPGSYRLFAVEAEREELLREEDVRSALEQQSARVTVEEGGSATADLTVIPSSVVEKAAADAE